MRKLIGCVLVLAVAGCASGGLNLPAEPFGSGVYRLVAVQGFELPHTLEDVDMIGVEIISGNLRLNADNTFEMRIDGRAQLSALKPLTFTRNYLGQYGSSPMGATLKWQTAVATTGAFSDDNSLRVYRDGVEYVFTRD